MVRVVTIVTVRPTVTVEPLGTIVTPVSTETRVAVVQVVTVVPVVGVGGVGRVLRVGRCEPVVSVVTAALSSRVAAYFLSNSCGRLGHPKPLLIKDLRSATIEVPPSWAAGCGRLGRPSETNLRAYRACSGIRVGFCSPGRVFSYFMYSVTPVHLPTEGLGPILFRHFTRRFADYFSFSPYFPKKVLQEEISRKWESL